MYKHKIMALLHDPIHKQILINLQEIDHEKLAEDIIQMLGITPDKEKWNLVKKADQIASPMSRTLIPPILEKQVENFIEHSKVYFDDLKFIDIFKGKVEDAEAPIKEILDCFEKIEKEIEGELEDMLKSCKIQNSVISNYKEKLENYLSKELLKFNTQVRLPKLEVGEYSCEDPNVIKNFNKKIEDFNKQIIDNLKVFESLRNLLKKLEVVQDKDIIFLFFWRFLPEIFPWINKHPAESRAPNHSIYDHLVQTSAVFSTLSTKPAFLLFTISPVQEFISKARKTSDLWAGSYMLSYLIYKCIEVIMENLGPDNVVFPNLLGQPLVDRWLYFKLSQISNLDEPKFKEWYEKLQNFKASEDKSKEIEEKLTIANFPNRFLAIIPYDQNNSLAKKVEEAFRNELEEISKKVFNKLSNFSSNQNLQLQIKSHLLNYFQAYWVVLPWTNDTQNYSPNEALEDYAKLISNKNEPYETIKTILSHRYYNCNYANVGYAYSLLLELTEKLLGARKSIRNVLEENYYESRGEKCHLCGEFEVLDIDWDNLRNNEPGLVKKSERLCGVCMTKRLFPEIIKEKLNLSDTVKFPSTSEMASISEKRRLNSNFKENFVSILYHKPWFKKLPSTISVPKLKNDPLYKVDGQFLMEETYRVDYFEKEFGVKVSENDFNDILETLRKCNVNPSKYYAILQMDGDNMGKWLKGEFNPEIKDTIHTKVVDAFISYSEGIDKEEIQKLLRSKHPNSPSIHQAFSRRLSQFAIEKVRKIVEDYHYGKLIYAGGDDMLAFLPIEEVLNCAYNLQGTFKEVLSPKASMSAGIVIVHHKYPLYLALKEVRSAEKIAKDEFKKDAFCIRVIPHSGEVRETGGKWELVNFMNDLICKFKNEQIPSTFAKEFSEVYENEMIENKELLKVELKRIYFGKKAKDKNYIDEIIEHFEKYSFDVKYFVNLFLISRFLSKEVRI